MIQEFSRVLNIFAVIMLSLFLVAMQSIIFRMPILAWLEIDLILLLVIHIALNRGLVEGTFLVLVLSRVTEIHSASPVGVMLICYLFVYLGVLFSKEMFLVNTGFSSILMAMGAGLAWKLIYLFLALEMGFFSNIWQAVLWSILPFLLGIGILSQPFLAFLRRFDLLTGRRRDQHDDQLAGEEY